MSKINFKSTKAVNIALAAVIFVVAIGVFYLFMFKDDTKDAENNSGGSDVVAVVNGQEIKRPDFEAVQAQVAAQQGLDPKTLAADQQKQLSDQAVQAIVSQTLLEQAVQKSDVRVSDEDIDQQVQLVKGRFESAEAFDQALASQGTSEEKFRAQIQSELVIQAYLEQELNLGSISASEDEVNEVYEQQKKIAGDNLPPLDQVRDQVKQLAIQQKQQQLIAGLIQKLRQDADINIRI